MFTCKHTHVCTDMKTWLSQQQQLVTTASIALNNRQENYTTLD